MTRFGKRLAAGTSVLALAAVPGVTAAHADTGVDEGSGPVAYANAASLVINLDDDAGTDPARVVTETQRSPLGAGESRLDQAERSVVPEGGEAEIMPNYLLNLGAFAEGKSPFPPGVQSRQHDVSASLDERHIPSASAETNYALRYRGPDGFESVLALQGAHTAASCPAPGEASASTSASSLWLTGASGNLEQVPVPTGDEPVRREGLKFGPPTEVPDAEQVDFSSDITVSRVSSFDQLVRQDAWRGGDVTAVGGWQVEIVTHITPAQDGATPQDQEGEADVQGDTGRPTTNQEASESADDAGSPAKESGDEQATTPRAQQEQQQSERVVRTRIVLGGVSCSIPRDFTPVTASPAGGGAPQPAVPVTVRAGGAPPADGTPTGLGFGLLGGGIVLGGVALLVGVRTRRRDPAPGKR